MTEHWEPISVLLRMMQHAIADAEQCIAHDDHLGLKITIRDLGWLIFECDQRWQRLANVPTSPRKDGNDVKEDGNL
jgi:hypothetical protein